MQARQQAELSATTAEDKLKAHASSVQSRNGEAGRASKGDHARGYQAKGDQANGDQAKAMADLDASLMQRLDEDCATNHRLMESLKATQVGTCMCCFQRQGRCLVSSD